MKFQFMQNDVRIHTQCNSNSYFNLLCKYQYVTRPEKTGLIYSQNLT